MSMREDGSPRLYTALELDQLLKALGARLGETLLMAAERVARERDRAVEELVEAREKNATLAATIDRVAQTLERPALSTLEEAARARMNSLENTRRQLNNLSRDYADRNKRMQDAGRLVTELRRQLADEADRFRNLSGSACKLVNDRDRLEKQLEDSEARRSHLEQRLGEVERERDTWKECEQTSCRKNETLQIRIENLTRERDDARQKLADAALKIQGMEAAADGLLSELDSAHKENAAVERVLKVIGKALEAPEDKGYLHIIDVAQARMHERREALARCVQTVTVPMTQGVDFELERRSMEMENGTRPAAETPDRKPPQGGSGTAAASMPPATPAKLIVWRSSDGTYVAEQKPSRGNYMHQSWGFDSFTGLVQFLGPRLSDGRRLPPADGAVVRVAAVLSDVFKQMLVEVMS